MDSPDPVGAGGAGSESRSSDSWRTAPWAIFLIFLRLGSTSFGGPIAHLGYFRAEFVVRRQWLSERSYADLVALCQFLPGPASSQVGIALGLSRAGYRGALAAWAGFTLPSAVALVLFALGLSRHGELVPPDALHGLKIAAVAVVAQAVWGMARSLCPDAPRIAIMTAAACAVLLVPSAWGQVAVIAAGGIVGLLLLAADGSAEHDPLPFTVSHQAGVIALALFFALLIALPFLSAAIPSQAGQMGQMSQMGQTGQAAQTLAVVDAFYRAGALVFGGGHVVLPMLQAEVVPPGWVANDTFLAGYGAAQAVPGPLFTFAAFLGASMNTASSGWTGALICLLAIFTPSFLLVVGAAPFWGKLRGQRQARSALSGINAAVVGVLLAALYHPVWTSAIHRPQDFALALTALVALMFWRVPPWLVVLGCAPAAWMLGRWLS